MSQGRSVRYHLQPMSAPDGEAAARGNKHKQQLEQALRREQTERSEAAAQQQATAEAAGAPTGSQKQGARFAALSQRIALGLLGLVVAVLVGAAIINAFAKGERENARALAGVLQAQAESEQSEDEGAGAVQETPTPLPEDALKKLDALSKKDGAAAAWAGLLAAGSKPSAAIAPAGADASLLQQWSTTLAQLRSALDKGDRSAALATLKPFLESSNPEAKLAAQLLSAELLTQALSVDASASAKDALSAIDAAEASLRELSETPGQRPESFRLTTLRKIAKTY